MLRSAVSTVQSVLPLSKMSDVDTDHSRCLWTTLQQLRGCWKLLGEQGDRLFNTLNMDHANTSTIVEENSPPAGAGRRKHKHHGLVGAGTASPKVKDFAYRMESQAPSSLA
ncbi:unnamed protein product [Effrenium voratum]|nr:unnamed protein product [Effrenium voratum]